MQNLKSKEMPGISATAFKKTRIGQDTPETHIKLIDPADLQMPEVSYPEKRDIEKQVARIQEEANARIAELLREKSSKVGEQKNRIVG